MSQNKCKYMILESISSIKSRRIKENDVNDQLTLAFLFDLSAEEVTLYSFQESQFNHGKN